MSSSCTSVTSAASSHPTSITTIAGIINEGGTATVANSTFSGNSGGYGGGIYNEDGPLTVTNSTFFFNVGAWHCEFEVCGAGGGIYDSGSGMLTVVNSTFSGNTSRCICRSALRDRTEKRFWAPSYFPVQKSG